MDSKCFGTYSPTYNLIPLAFSPLGETTWLVSRILSKNWAKIWRIRRGGTPGSYRPKKDRYSREGDLELAPQAVDCDVKSAHLSQAPIRRSPDVSRALA